MMRRTLDAPAGLRASSAPSAALSRIALALIGLGIAASAFLPRVAGLDRGFMIDEKLWLDRSVRFVDAVFDGRLGQAWSAGHPGITTSWAAGLAQKTLPDDATLLQRFERARLGIVVVNVLLIVLIWLLLRGLVGEVAAGFGALLLSFDPFVFGLTRVAHVDGLQTLAMTASIVALIRGVRNEDRRMMAIAGAFAGFAFLTRSFAGYMVLVAVVALWRDGRGIRRRLVPFLIAGAVVVVALWPLIWVRPWKAVSVVVYDGLIRGVSDDSDTGRFFLGAHIPAPGPIFYPVALALRLTIVTFVGGIVAAVWAVRRRRTETDAQIATSLLWYGLGFVALVSLTLKTADRYLLPVIAALDLVVAIGLARALMRRRAAVRAVLLAVILSLQAPSLAVHPYELAEFNWALGGPYTAQHAIPIGRGEGLDQAARDLSRLSNARALTVATTRLTGFEEFFPGRTIRIEDSALVTPGGPRPDLVLFYISSVQVGRLPNVWARYRDRPTFYLLTINSIPYVRVYTVDPR